MELERIYVEELVFDGGSVDITDPGSTHENPFSLTVNVARGSYGCYVYMDEDGNVWVCQIASSEPTHRQFLLENIHNEELWENIGVVGVDSGYAGFFDKKPELTEEQWVEMAKEMTEEEGVVFIDDFSDENDPTPNDGFWATAAEGDDLYSVYALKCDGEIVAVEIRFNEGNDILDDLLEG